MRTISSTEIIDQVAGMVVSAARDLEPDILEAMVAARDREESDLSRDVLDLLLVNADMASREQLPVCQDTGVCTVFVEIGDEVAVRDLSGAIEEETDEGQVLQSSNSLFSMFDCSTYCGVMHTKTVGNFLHGIITRGISCCHGRSCINDGVPVFGERTG